METWIALLRGINVGGRNKLPMQSLRTILTSLDLEDVQTYIQSGNAVFRAVGAEPSRLADQIGERIESEHGFRPSVQILSLRSLRAALDANPFPEAEENPKTLHFFFLREAATQADSEALKEKRAPNEHFSYSESVFYLYAPEGIGRSKLAASAERLLGVSVTARNLRSVRKILELASTLA